MKVSRLVVVLLVLLALVQLESPRAALSILWRGAVLSFDNPATQALDELVSGASPVADPAAEARRSTRAAAAVSTPFAHDVVAVAARPAADLARFTRAPPAA